MGTIYSATNPPEQVQTRRPAVTFSRRDISPPSNVYVLPDDLLIIQGVASPSNSTINVNYRLLRADGTIQTGVSQFTIIGGIGVQTFTQQLAEGFMLSLQINRSSGIPPVVPTFVQIGLARGGGAAPIPYTWFLAGYVPVVQALTFPASGVRRPTDGQGFLLYTPGPGPALGAEAQILGPVGMRAHPIFISFQLTTSAAAGNRTVGLLFFTNLVVVPFSNGTFLQGPGTVVQYCAAGYSGGSVNFGTFIELSLPPDLRITSGVTIRTRTTNLDVNDQYGPLQMWWEQWVEDF